MLSVKQLFIADGLQCAEDEIKLVRHTDHLGRSIRSIVDGGFFDQYQSEQFEDGKPFRECSIILSFIGLENRKSEFFGAYKVNGYFPFVKEYWKGMPDWLFDAHKDNKRRIFYDLEELKEFRSYRGRLIVRWRNPRTWCQKRDLEVHEILPA